MLDVNVKMLFTLFSKFLIYYTKFENWLLSFLTFSIVVYLVEKNIKFSRYMMFFTTFAELTMSERFTDYKYYGDKDM